MKYLIWPIALFIAEYFSFNFPVYYGLRIQIYVYIIFIIASVFLMRGNIPKDIFSDKVIKFIFILLSIQLCSMLISSFKIDIEDYYRNPIKTYILFCGFILAISIHYFVVRLNVRNIEEVNSFLKSGWIALIITLFVSFSQLAYIIFPIQFQSLVELIGGTIEARWGGKNANDANQTGYYTLGSYVQTTLRLNGLTEEAPSLATQLFVVFIPFIIASIKNQYNIFYKNRSKMLPLYIVLILILIILIAAKTTSGFLFAGIILLLVIKDMNMMKKIFFLSLSVLIVLLVIGFNFKNNYIIEIINDFILNKSENSINNRLGISIALIKITMQNFLTGIGWEYHPFFIYKNIPEWARYNSEYFSYIKRKDFPIMSVFLSWTAEYGLVIVTIVSTYLIKKQKQFRKISNKIIKEKKEEAKLIRVLCDSSKYYLLFTFISSLFLYVWYTSVYLIVFFFFISVIHVAQRRIEQ